MSLLQYCLHLENRLSIGMKLGSLRISDSVDIWSCLFVRTSILLYVTFTFANIWRIIYHIITKHFIAISHSILFCWDTSCSSYWYCGSHCECTAGAGDVIDILHRISNIFWANFLLQGWLIGSFTSTALYCRFIKCTLKFSWYFLWKRSILGKSACPQIK